MSLQDLSLLPSLGGPEASAPSPEGSSAPSTNRPSHPTGEKAASHPPSPGINSFSSLLKFNKTGVGEGWRLRLERHPILTGGTCIVQADVPHLMGALSGNYGGDFGFLLSLSPVLSSLSDTKKGVQQMFVE